MATQVPSVVRESRHLWVGGLPDQITEAELKDYFSKFGKIEGVKILPQKYPNIGVAAFVDFFDVKSAIDAKETKHMISGCELRTNFKAKPTEKFDGKKRPVDGLMSTDKQENVRGSASTTGSSDEDSDSSSSTSSAASLSGSENKKSSVDLNVLYLKVTGLANRPERVLQDGLYYEFCRYSSQAIVRMYGEGSEKKWAVVKYKKVEECREAYRQSQGMVLFGSKIRLVPLDINDFPAGGRDHPSVHHNSSGSTPKPFLSDETDLQATRSLFVGNIPKNISIFELRDAFQRYGNVLDVEIKKMGGNATYGFVLYYDLMSAITAKQYMDGQNLRGNTIRVGFGKGTASKTLWIDGIERNMTKQKLEKHLVKYGKIVRLGLDHSHWCAMAQYETIESAKEALNGLKGTFLGGGKRILTDFANRDARAAFFARIEEEERGSQSGHYQGSSVMFNRGMMGSDPRVMIPTPGMAPLIGMGRDSFHFQGPPMDYYYTPYMDDFYGGGRSPFGVGAGVSGPPGSRRFTHPQFGHGIDDYEDELRAFTRKREWEREREKRKVKRKYRDSSSDSKESDADLSLKQKKRSGKSKEKSKKVNKKDKDKEGDKSKEKNEGDSESNGSTHEEARLRATKKSRELREKLKKSKKKTAPKHSSSTASTSEDEVQGISNKPKNVPVSPSGTDKKDSSASDPIQGSLNDQKQTSVDVISTSSESLPACSLASFSSSKFSDEKSTQKVEISVASLPAKEVQSESGGEQTGDDLEVVVSLEKDQTVLDESQKEAKLESRSPQKPFRDNNKVEHVGMKVESDLSSGEDFRENDLEVATNATKKSKEYKPQPQSACSSDSVIVTSQQALAVFNAKKVPPEIDESTQKHEKVDNIAKKEQKLPRRYQIGEDSRAHSRDSSRRREHKVHSSSRPDRRLHHPLSSLSPPPQFGRRRRYHSPQPPESERRRQRRGRPSSPLPTSYRKASRSPPGFHGSPPYKARSPFSSSPPPRPRSPPMDHRGNLKRRYESPPYDNTRSTLSRRWSPPSPHHHHRSYIPSSPHRSWSPSGRRRPRHRTPSVSPTSRSPLWGSKHEGSPPQDLGGRSSPHHSEDRHDFLLKRHGKRPVHAFSRTPSPISKSKGRDINRSDLQDIKRIKLDDTPTTKLSKPPKVEKSQITHRTGLAQSEQKLLKQQQSAAQSKGTTQTNNSDSEMKESHQSVEVPIQQPTRGSQQHADNLLDLLRRYPVMWQGHLMLKNDMAAVQLHFLSGNLQLAKVCLPQPVEQHTPSLRIAQRMRLEKTQLEGVEKRIQNDGEHCLLLALPCGRDATDVHTQTNNLKNSLISYLIQKQAAGIINVQDAQAQAGYVLHIFPPCPFSQSHLSRVAPDLLSSASDNCHLMIVAATM